MWEFFCWKYVFCSICDGLLLCFLFFKDAVSKYQEVTNNLEFAKELQRSFMALSQDVSKEQVVRCGLSAAIPNTWALNSLSPILDAGVASIYRD